MESKKIKNKKMKSKKRNMDSEEIKEKKKIKRKYMDNYRNGRDYEWINGLRRFDDKNNKVKYFVFMIFKDFLNYNFKYLQGNDLPTLRRICLNEWKVEVEETESIFIASEEDISLISKFDVGTIERALNISRHCKMIFVLLELARKNKCGVFSLLPKVLLKEIKKWHNKDYWPIIFPVNHFSKKEKEE